MSAVNLAHLGGIDEIGISAIPVVLAVVALRSADKRARTSAAERDGDQVSLRRRDSKENS